MDKMPVKDRWDINTRPETWPVTLSDKYTGPRFNGEKMVNVIYGTFHPPAGKPENMAMFMRDSVYEKLISGEYTVAKDINRPSRIGVFDKSGNYVKPVGTAVY